MPFATPGMRGHMFSYAGPTSKTATRQHSGPFAVLDFQTTGLAPARGDRVVEVAVVRVDSTGDVLDEFATLVHPERDTGVPFLHGIADADVADAPTFQEVMPELLSRLSGAVVVAHNAPFEEAFLAAELKRAGVTGVRMPALCTLWLAQETFQTPNHKLWTLARDAGFPLLKRYQALGHARTEAKLLGIMLDRYGRPLMHDRPPYVAPTTATQRTESLRLVTRAVALRKGTDGWMHSLMARLPMSANEADDATTEVYLEALAEVMADGKIDAGEAKHLASLAGSGGLGGVQVAALNERFLESMREAAFADDVLTAAELRELTAAAKALGVPSYFDDLTPIAIPVAGTSRHPEAAAQVSGEGRVRRCGHCRQPGHYRKTCPELVDA